MKRILFLITIICMAITINIFANVEILSVSLEKLDGDVEIQLSEEKEWKEAEEGMKLKMGDLVSTGFDSTCVLKFENHSEVIVQPMTQFAISRFFRENDIIKTDLYLRTGTIDADIIKQSGVKSNFNIETPTATASVRGTRKAITFLDRFGTSTKVKRGIVDLRSKSGNTRRLLKNDISIVNPSNLIPTNPINQIEETARVTFNEYSRTEDEINDIRNQDTTITMPISEIQNTTNTISNNTDSGSLKYLIDFSR